MTGPFRECWDYVDESAYYESCLYDACVLGSDTEAVCSTFEQYAQRCQAYGQSVGDWRAPLMQCSKSILMSHNYYRCLDLCLMYCKNFLNCQGNCTYQGHGNVWDIIFYSHNFQNYAGSWQWYNIFQHRVKKGGTFSVCLSFYFTCTLLVIKME